MTKAERQRLKQLLTTADPDVWRSRNRRSDPEWGTMVKEEKQRSLRILGTVGVVGVILTLIPPMRMVWVALATLIMMTVVAYENDWYGLRPLSETEGACERAKALLENPDVQAYRDEVVGQGFPLLNVDLACMEKVEAVSRARRLCQEVHGTLPDALNG